MKNFKSKVDRHPIESIRPFCVTWKQLNYTTTNFRSPIKRILNDVSGYFESGQITAIMGPSGCGKSTLLGCISGQKRKGVSGSITISTDINVKLAKIDQDNYILKKLTVRESLTFASKLKNEFNADHNSLVNEVIDNLHIKDCADLRPNKCSGGQLKRVLIAIELVTKPNILILDEPTSGLDTVTALQLIQTLIELTKKAEPVAIVLTIHQPSAKLFNLFSNIYLMSYMGECIYFGRPQNIIGYFRQFGFNCPPYSNPADFSMEVAIGEHDHAKLAVLALLCKMDAITVPVHNFQVKSQRDKRTFNQIFQLTLRSLITSYRDPFIFVIRFFGYIICAIFISLEFGSNSGVLSGCAQDFTIEKGDHLFEKYEYVMRDIKENYAFISFGCLLAWFGGIFPVLLQFHFEMFNFIKEYRNGYYTCFSFLISKVLSDIPFSLFLPNVASFVMFYMTGQPSDTMWRAFNFAIIFILIVFNSSSLGFMIGVLLAQYPTAIAFLGMLSLVPLVLLSGVFVRLTAIPKLFQWMSYFNYFRFGLAAALLDIYGFGRCADQSQTSDSTSQIISSLTPEKMLEIYSSDKINAELLFSTLNTILGTFTQSFDNRSIVLKFYTLFDSDYNFSIFMLILHLFMIRSITYFIILKKIEYLT